MDVAQLSISVDSRDVKTATTDVMNLADAAKTAAAAFASWKIVRFAKDAALLAARYETLGVVMGIAGNNAGYTAKEMQGFEKALQATGISMVESRDVLTSMATANIDLAKSTKLARAAQDLAVVGNMNSSEAFKSMVYGIKSAQTEILRTLGLNVQFEEGYKRMGRELKKNAQDLTTQEKLQSRVNQVLAEAAKYNGIYQASMGTAGKQLKSMERYAQDLEVSIGAVFGPLLKAAVEKTTEALKVMAEWVEKNKIGLSAAGEHLAVASRNFSDVVRDAAGMAAAAGDLSDDFTWVEVLAASLSGIVAFFKDIFNVVSGLIQMILSGIATLVSHAATSITQLFGFQPPAWLASWAEGSANWAVDAQRRFASGITAESISGVMNPSHTPAPGSSVESELARIKKGELERLKQKEEELKKTREEAAKAYAKEMERQAKVVSDLNIQLQSVGASELQIMRIRIDSANLTDVKQAQAYRIAQEISDKKLLLQIEKDRVEWEREKIRLADEWALRTLTEGAEARKQEMAERIAGERRYNPGMEAQARMKELGKLKLSPEAQTAALRELRYEFDATFRTLSDGMMNLGDNMARSFSAWIMKIDGAKFALKDLTRSFAADVAQMFAQQAMRQFVGWMMGGISNSWGATPGAAPAAVKPAAMAGGQTVNVTINGATGAVESTSVQGGGADLGKRIGAAVRAVIVDERRSGGLLASVR